MFCYVNILSTLLCLMLLHQNGSALKTCPAGHKRNYNTNVCEKCPKGQYKNTSGTQITCDNCSKCRKGSEEKKQCTSTTDTECKCKEGFEPINQLSQTCICRKGSGVDKQGKCKKCMKGYFSDKDDSTCQKWRDCKSGVRTPGTNISDAVCKNVAAETKETTTEAPNTTLFPTTKTTTVATLQTTNSPDQNTDFYILWLVIISTGIVLMAGLLYYKCKVTHCIHNIKKFDSRKESVCRKPVEESGEKCLSLLV